jgi:hypothetical protein
MPYASDAAETLHIDGKLATTRTATSDDTTGGHRWLAQKLRTILSTNVFRRAGESDQTLSGFGAFHVPLRASGFGQYNRSTMTNGPFGAGSQLASLSAPGDAFWT